MKNVIIVFTVVIVIAVTGFMACNSSDKVSKNQEGIIEMKDR